MYQFTSHSKLFDNTLESILSNNTIRKNLHLLYDYCGFNENFIALKHTSLLNTFFIFSMKEKLSFITRKNFFSNNK